MTRVITVVAARMGSRRLPGKALLDLNGRPLLGFLFERIRATKLGGQLYLATTSNPSDDVLAAYVSKLGIAVFRGAQDDVAERHLRLAQAVDADWIVRITGDCPFVDAISLDYCLAQCDFLNSSKVYSTKGVFPTGIDYEIFSTALLAAEWPTMTAEEKEHLTLRFYQKERTKAKVIRLERPSCWPSNEGVFTVDTEADYLKALAVVKTAVDGFSIRDLLRL
jgi:spore coat polysaccharide biosynthesis protein SpsF (cytidylyltransferase family)